MITGVHALLYAQDAERARAFFRDVLEFRSVEAGDGWLIFALPPAEMGIHPTDDEAHHELSLLCDDLATTMKVLRAKGAEFVGEVTDRGWGLVARLRIPGGGTMLLYESRHPTAHSFGAKNSRRDTPLQTG